MRIIEQPTGTVRHASFTNMFVQRHPTRCCWVRCAWKGVGASLGTWRRRRSASWPSVWRSRPSERSSAAASPRPSWQRCRPAMPTSPACCPRVWPCKASMSPAPRGIAAHCVWLGLSCTSGPARSTPCVLRCLKGSPANECLKGSPANELVACADGDQALALLLPAVHAHLQHGRAEEGQRVAHACRDRLLAYVTGEDALLFPVFVCRDRYLGATCRAEGL